MSDIVLLMKAFGLTVGEGVCHGCAVMSVQAAIVGKHKDYQRRLEQLAIIAQAIRSQYSSTELAWQLGTTNTQERIARLQEIIKSRYAAAELPHVFSDMRAYLEGVALFQEPENYRQLFDSKIYIFQHDVEKVVEIGQSLLAKEKGGIRKVVSFSGSYEIKRDLVLYLSCLKTLVWNAEEQKTRCALLLAAAYHSVALTYDGTSARWFGDSDGQVIILSSTPDSVPEEVGIFFEALFEATGVLQIFSTTVYSTGDCFEEARASYRGLKSRADWKALHAVTSPRVGRQDTNKFNWFFAAVRIDEIDMVLKLLAEGADVNVMDQKGNRPILLAVVYGYIDIFKVLLDKGADVNVVDQKGNSPILLAVVHGYIDIFKVLLDKGADVNVVDQEGKSPLLFAVAYGYIDIIALLLDKGADVNVVDQEGYSPLLVAVDHADIDIVKLLLRAGANVNLVLNMPDQEDFSLLYLAVQEGYVDIVEVLLAKGANVNFTKRSGYTPLCIAVQYERLEILKQLLTAGAKVDVLCKLSMLQEASRIAMLRKRAVGQERAAEFEHLLKTLTDQSDEFLQVTPLELALYFGYPEIALTLLRSQQVDRSRTSTQAFVSCLMADTGYYQQAAVCEARFAEAVEIILRTTYPCSASLQARVVAAAIQTRDNSFRTFRDHFDARLESILKEGMADDLISCSAASEDVMQRFSPTPR